MRGLRRSRRLLLRCGRRCGRRATAQLLLLPVYASQETAGVAREAWLGLAGAGHHHVYELAPTAAELRGWLTAVRELGVLLERSVAGRARRSRVGVV